LGVTCFAIRTSESLNFLWGVNSVLFWCKHDRLDIRFEFLKRYTLYSGPSHTRLPSVQQCEGARCIP